MVLLLSKPLLFRLLCRSHFSYSSWLRLSIPVTPREILIAAFKIRSGNLSGSSSVRSGRLSVRVSLNVSDRRLNGSDRRLNVSDHIPKVPF